MEYFHIYYFTEDKLLAKISLTQTYSNLLFMIVFIIFSGINSGKSTCKPDMVAHACNTGTWEAKAGLL